MKSLREREEIEDKKSWLVYGILSKLNRMVLARKFARIEVFGKENLPKNGPFLLVSNHVSRYDGLIIYKLIDRPTNFMVSPNELLGLQGKILRSMGSFPADPRTDLIGFAQQRIESGEGVVVFPEGDIYRDGSTHTFKNGASRVVLGLASRGLKIPVIPLAVHYDDERGVAKVNISSPVDIEDYLELFGQKPAEGLRCLSNRLHREVCCLRRELGARNDLDALYTCRGVLRWGIAKPL